MSNSDEIYLAEYAAIYDSIYNTPTYSTKVIIDLLGRPSQLLDLGCGTGRHSEQLIRDKYEHDRFMITGVDSSEPMLEIARAKMPEHTWICSPVANFKVKHKHHQAIMLGDILSYHTDRRDLRQALNNINYNLEVGAPFLFDFWYAPAVLIQKPSTTVKTVGNTTRTATSKLMTEFNTCHVRYEFETGEEKRHEDHYMRYFSIPEIIDLLELTGFQFDAAVAPDGSHPTENNWHILVRATVRGLGHKF